MAERAHHRAVDRVAAILEAVATERGGLTLTQLAHRLDAPVSSIQKLVNGLVAVGYLDEEDLRFTLGAAPYLLAARAGRLPARLVRHEDLVALSAAHGCGAVLAVRLGDASVHVDWAGTDDPFTYLTVRRLRTPLPETAVGRVLLAHLPERDRHEVVAAHTTGDAEALALLAELAEIRERGYSIGDSGPMLRGIAAVAAPVTAAGRVVGAASLAGQRAVVGDRLPALAEALVAAVGEWAARA